MNPKYPVYIISKGRADTRFTARSLEEMGVPYRIVIEPQEYDKYAAVIDPKKILVLPFSNLGQGSIPARNWVWEHSISEGHERHWIMDDNIRYFYRLNRNRKVRVRDGSIIRAAEDFTDRYENVKMAGLNYAFFCPSDLKRPPYYLNTRIYSCILLANDIPLRWRGRYNEDTDLSLRILKDNYCTLLFNAFLCGKMATMTMKGGNTEEVYAKNQQQFDNRRTFAESLKAQHPDVVEITMKWGRWHHHVDYSPFKHQLKMKEGLVIPKGNNEYGMTLRRATEEEVADGDKYFE
jgi:hypothetical protein